VGVPTGGTNGQVLTKNSATNYDTIWSSPSGTGTVTSVTAGNLLPLFAASVSNSTTTPAITFTAPTAPANTFYGNSDNATSATPAFVRPNFSNLLGTASLAQGGTGTTLGAEPPLGNPPSTVPWYVPIKNNAGQVAWMPGSGNPTGVPFTTNPTFIGTLTVPTLVPTNIIGTNTNNNAAAGAVGETVTSALPSASQVVYTSAQTKNLTSISLTAGDWDVRGNVNCFFNNLPANTSYAASASISTTTNTQVDDGFGAGVIATAPSATTLTRIGSLALPPHRVSLSSTTTIYLVVTAPTFASGGFAAYGFIEARRMR